METSALQVLFFFFLFCFFVFLGESFGRSFKQVGWRRKQAGLVRTHSSFVHHKKQGLLKTDAVHRSCQNCPYWLMTVSGKTCN